MRKEPPAEIIGKLDQFNSEATEGIELPCPPTLSQLVGTVISDRYGDPYGTRSPGPIRAYPKTPSTVKSVIFDSLRFSFGEGYVGTWHLGLQQPWFKVSPKSKQVKERSPWLPHMMWEMWRPIKGSRFTECHHGDHESLAHEGNGSGMLAKLNEILDPKLSLHNSKFFYVVTASLAATFEDHLAAYLERADVVDVIARLKSFD